MKKSNQEGIDTRLATTATIDSSTRDLVSSTSETLDKKGSEVSSWSSIFAPAFSIFGSYSNSSNSSSSETRVSNSRIYGWTILKRVVCGGGTMRRLHDRILGSSKTGVCDSSSDIWLLGVCYKASPKESSEDALNDNEFSEFANDFSSRIWITYRKGFDAIGDSKFTSDVNWGCMLRSSQMLVAQALLFHHLGRSWRKPLEKPFSQEYIKILELFSDSEEAAFSIHNLLQAGKAHGLAAGSWIGPYAMCRSWEALAHSKREQGDKESLPMSVYVVSGDENGERGGAPVVCIEDVAKLCSDYSDDQAVWKPILLLVPLVLGLDKVNPRYFPSLWTTFTFPQSLGILGGKPGASTYIVGVQDDQAFYLDPHQVQLAIDMKSNKSEADTSTYHCNVVRHHPLDMIDPSLAIGFYCRDKDDFDDFCARASKVAEASEGAPLFTVETSRTVCNSVREDVLAHCDFHEESVNESDAQEDEWQFL
ncbi:Cysteine protease atg4 [Ranunculus cassubicifolius]